ncbi:hypothetical protein MAFF212519_26030 [Clavibacter michiganensis]
MTHPAETHPAETHPTEGDPVVTTSPIPMPTPPRRVRIGDAAAFVGITPRTIRHYHQIGLIPEPERGTDDRRRYGYADMVRLMWIRRMADAGIALEDIRAAFADPEAGEGAAAAADTAAHAAPAAAGDDDVADVLGRLEATLAAQEAELRRQRDAVRRLRARAAGSACSPTSSPAASMACPREPSVRPTSTPCSSWSAASARSSRR